MPVVGGVRAVLPGARGNQVVGDHGNVGDADEGGEWAHATHATPIGMVAATAAAAVAMDAASLPWAMLIWMPAAVTMMPTSSG
jgi:hypothetical protein